MNGLKLLIIILESSFLSLVWFVSVLSSPPPSNLPIFEPLKANPLTTQLATTTDSKTQRKNRKNHLFFVFAVFRPFLNRVLVNYSLWRRRYCCCCKSTCVRTCSPMTLCFESTSFIQWHLTANIGGPNTQFISLTTTISHQVRIGPSWSGVRSHWRQFLPPSVSRWKKFIHCTIYRVGRKIGLPYFKFAANLFAELSAKPC